MKNIFDRIKKNLITYNRKKIISFFFFIIISFSLWFIIALNKNYVDNIKLKIYYKNIPDSAILLNELPDFINVKVSGKGGIILAYQLRLKKASLNINLERFFNKKEDSLSLSESLLEQFITEVIDNDLNILNFKPSEINIRYTSLRRKFVKVIPVFTDYDHLIESQYSLSGYIKVIPDKVEVYGISYILDTLKSIYTEAIKLKNLKDTAKVTVKLQTIENIRFGKIDQVMVVIPVDRIIDAKIVKDIKVFNVPENYKLQLFPSSVSISFKIPMSIYRHIEETMLQPCVDFKEISDLQNAEYLNVFLKDTLPFAKEITITPDKVEFLIKKIK